MTAEEEWTNSMVLTIMPIYALVDVELRGKNTIACSEGETEQTKCL